MKKENTTSGTCSSYYYSNKPQNYYERNIFIILCLKTLLDKYCVLNYFLSI